MQDSRLVLHLWLSFGESFVSFTIRDGADEADQLDRVNEDSVILLHLFHGLISLFSIVAVVLDETNIDHRFHSSSRSVRQQYRQGLESLLVSTEIFENDTDDFGRL